MANPALIDELEKQFRDNPRRVFARLANEYRKAGDYMRAIEICHAHVPQQPGYISGHIVLGQALYDAGEMDQALQTFQTALSLDPENLIALRQLGDIARSRRDYREARDWYTRLLEVDPQNEEIVAQLGEIALEEEPAARNGDGTYGGDDAAEAAMPALTFIDDEGEPSEESGAEPAEEEPPLAEGLTMSGSEPDFASFHHSDVRPATPEEMDARDFAPLVIDEDSDSASHRPEQTAAAGTDFGDDVSWVVAEGEGSLDEALIIEEAVEVDDTDRIVAKDFGATDGSAEPATADFDFTFEAEEFDVPLRPHTGESLSVIAEEDALAGVQATHRQDPAPFGELVEDAAAPDDDDAARDFEPLPIEEIDAAAESVFEDATPVDAEAGEDAVPASEHKTEHVRETYESPALMAVDDHASVAGSEESVSVSEPEDELPAAEPPAPRADTYDLGEAETLIEDDAFEMWGSTAESSTEIDSAAPPSPGDEFGWESGAVPLPDESHGERGWEPAGATSAMPSEQGTEVEGLTSASEERPEDARTDEYAGYEAVLEENERSAPESDAGLDEATVAGEPEPKAVPTAFVTETMAELYLKQGFRNEAIEVYRKLVAQAPGDEVFRARLAELEEGYPQTPEPESSGETPAAPASPLQRPAAAFFKSLASVPAPAASEVPPAAEPHVAPAEPVSPAAEASGAKPQDSFSDWVDFALAEAGEVEEEDEAAAMALANGFAPEPPHVPATRAADGEMSLSDVFRGSGRSGRATPGSLDAFFTPDGERAGDAPQGENTEDLEAFNAWLEGLKK